MNVHELPLILFTVLAQMSVGAFVVLGCVQLFARIRHDARAADHITTPAVYAIGPVLVFGLVASMAHLGNPFNALNTFRHLGSSWLSREIVFGIGFAGLGFLFAALQWFRWGSRTLRQVLAVATAVVGIGLVYVMSMVYASLETVPVWNSWTTLAQFYLTTFLLGCLAVGAAFLTVAMWRARGWRLQWLENLRIVKWVTGFRGPESEAPGGDSPKLLLDALRWVAMATVVLLGVQLTVIVLQQTTMAQDPQMPAASVAAYASGWFVARLVLLVAGAGLLGMLLYRMVSQNRPLQLLAMVATTAFVLVLASEIIGRSIFYTAMVRIGI